LTHIISSPFMYSRLQRAALFPYTTLFRSAGWVQYTHFPLPPSCSSGIQRIVARVSSLIFASHSGLPHQNEYAKPVSTAFFSTRSDRKSTRLNSSHDQISYAVFCLKKKIYI